MSLNQGVFYELSLFFLVIYSMTKPVIGSAQQQIVSLALLPSLWLLSACKLHWSIYLPNHQHLVQLLEMLEERRLRMQSCLFRFWGCFCCCSKNSECSVSLLLMNKEAAFIFIVIHLFWKIKYLLRFWRAHCSLDYSWTLELDLDVHITSLLCTS